VDRRIAAIHAVEGSAVVSLQARLEAHFTASPSLSPAQVIANRDAYPNNRR